MLSPASQPTLCIRRGWLARLTSAMCIVTETYVFGEIKDGRQPVGHKQPLRPLLPDGWKASSVKCTVPKLHQPSSGVRPKMFVMTTTTELVPPSSLPSDFLPFPLFASPLPPSFPPPPRVSLPPSCLPLCVSLPPSYLLLCMSLSHSRLPLCAFLPSLPLPLPPPHMHSHHSIIHYTHTEHQSAWTILKTKMATTSSYTVLTCNTTLKNSKP